MSKIYFMIGFMTVAAAMLFSCADRTDRSDFALTSELHVCGDNVVELRLRANATDEDMQLACLAAGY